MAMYLDYTSNPNKNLSMIMDQIKDQILETERLRLRKFNETDADFIVELLNSPGWLQYIGDRHVRTGEQAVQYLVNGPMKSYVQNGFGLCMVERKEDKK